MLPIYRANYIKFRAFDIAKKQMKLVSQLDFLKVAVKENYKDNGKICDVWIDGQNISSFPNKTECVLMQWTNTHDMNGKEIYEFDIHKSEFGYHIIFFNLKYADYSIMHSDYTTKKGVWMFEPDKINIVGNIFENPDLIGKNFNPIEFIFS